MAHRPSETSAGKEALLLKVGCDAAPTEVAPEKTGAIGLGAEARMSVSIGLGRGTGHGDLDAGATLVARVHFS